ncbi:MAG: UDP-N-acetylglucosamine 1-carboxyvinyltransferase [bacterium]|nr:UDP-N-acetylglucosamine 1-carboxyvinyltransferase [bacterium]
MSHLVVNGGKKLHGTIVNQSAKNSAVALLCACLMIKGKSILVDVPEIEEVNRIAELLSSIGVVVEKLGNGKWAIDASPDLHLEKIDRRACAMTRSSLFLLGALANRAKSYKLYKTGGCKLGQRTVRPHLYALNKLGVDAESKEKFYEVTNGQLKSGHIVMYESGDTATENAIMAAVFASGKTVLKMASANYMVQDLCWFLARAGAKISGIGSTTLEIVGVKELKPVVNYPVMPDPIVAMTFIAAAITTGSHITVKDCPLEFLELELTKLEVMGQKFILKNTRLSKNDKFELVDIEVFPSTLIALPDKIYGRPFPGLNIDNLSLFVPILTRANGRTLVHDWAYENRATYYLDLQKLGANITLLDPHRVWVEGPTKFRPKELIAPTALRPAVDVLICMLAAPGKSILRNPYEIDRGYENLYEVLNQAGADIKVIKD